VTRLARRLPSRAHSFIHSGFAASGAWCWFWTALLLLEGCLTICLVWPLCDDPKFVPCQTFRLGMIPAPPIFALTVAGFAIVLVADRQDIAVAAITALHVLVVVQIATLIQPPASSEFSGCGRAGGLPLHEAAPPPTVELLACNNDGCSWLVSS